MAVSIQCLRVIGYAHFDAATAYAMRSPGLAGMPTFDGKAVASHALVGRYPKATHSIAATSWKWLQSYLSRKQIKDVSKG